MPCFYRDGILKLILVFVKRHILEVHSDRPSRPCQGQILQSHGNGTSAAISCGLLARTDRSPSSDQTYKYEEFTQYYVKKIYFIKITT